MWYCLKTVRTRTENRENTEEKDMKVVAINGSPRKGGNCAQMLEVLGKVLKQEGIEFEVCQPGAKVHPCMACYHCLDNGTLRCVQDDDGVNEIIAKCIEADGIVDILKLSLLVF